MNVKILELKQECAAARSEAYKYAISTGDAAGMKEAIKKIEAAEELMDKASDALDDIPCFDIVAAAPSDGPDVSENEKKLRELLESGGEQNV